MKPRRIPRVALLVETSLGYGRGLLRGIVRYARLHGPWAFYITPGDLVQVLPKMDKWGGTGIIARIETPEVEEAILASGLPFVALDLSHEQHSPKSPLAHACEIRPDSHQAGRLAAEHLLNKGFREFAFVGVHGSPPWSSYRQEGYGDRLAESGHTWHVCPLPKRQEDREWGCEQALMVRWIQALPKPIGIMACDDARGHQVLEAVRAGGSQVPEDVAVIGVDNDELMCELSDPPLSSVKLDLERGGYAAAALLDGLMSGRVSPPQTILVPAQYVVARRSTDVLHLDDRLAAEAIRFIRDHAGHPIGVRELVQHVGVSRRSLELRIRRIAGRSIRQEIQRVHIERAKRLLTETDLSIAAVASGSGFGSASYLARVFHQEVGLPPSEYRERLSVPWQAAAQERALAESPPRG